MYNAGFSPAIFLAGIKRLFIFVSKLSVVTIRNKLSKDDGMNLLRAEETASEKLALVPS